MDNYALVYTKLCYYCSGDIEILNVRERDTRCIQCGRDQINRPVNLKVDPVIQRRYSASENINRYFNFIDFTLTLYFHKSIVTSDFKDDIISVDIDIQLTQSMKRNIYDINYIDFHELLMYIPRGHEMSKTRFTIFAKFLDVLVEKGINPLNVKSFSKFFTGHKNVIIESLGHSTTSYIDWYVSQNINKLLSGNQPCES